MGRKRHDRPRQPAAGHFELERTLADAEADEAALSEAVEGEADTRCICGHGEFVLEAFMHVIGGRLEPVPVEVEGLTCPECGREYEAVPAGDGRVLRGDFRGWADLDD